MARKLSVRKARGVCGWFNAELRVLPRQALGDLAQILQSLSADGFPADLMKARVAVLSKVPVPTGASQARPITILSCLFRLGARVLCCQVLSVWSLTLPPAISGCLRGRSALDLAYAVQAEVETCLHAKEDLSGLSLDLRKAFNLLPRAPICRLLGIPRGCHLRLRFLAPLVGVSPAGVPGSPEPLALIWALPRELRRVTRPPFLAMIGVCWLFVRLLEGLVSPRAYVDNWSWTSDCPDNHGPALLVLQDLTASLRLQIDWAKTYVWALLPVSRSWWGDVGPAFVPEGVQLEIVPQVKELGSLFCFRRRPHSATFQARVQDALGRLNQLATDPQGLPVRARVIQGGVWPFLFYGTEACLPSCSVLSTLRSAAARAIVGDHKTLSPWAALCFVPGAQDPEVYLLCHHLRQLRRSFRVAPRSRRNGVVPSCRCAGLQSSSLWPSWGTAALVAAEMGAPFSPTGDCRGPLHQFFNIRVASMRQICAAVETAWADVVHDNVVHRNGLRFCPVPNAGMTMSSAGWAVVRADRPEEAPDLPPARLESQRLLSDFTIVAMGSTPGVQTVPRAELAALVWASAWVAQSADLVAEAYSDCQAAIDLWADWERHGWDHVASRCNADLLSLARSSPRFCGS